MRPILVLLRKDFTLMLRDRASLSITFLVPFVLIYLFGQIFGVNQPDPGPRGIPLAVVNASDRPAAARLLDALKAEPTFRVVTDTVNPDKTRRPLTEADLAPMIRANEFHFAVVIPADVIRSDRLGLHLKVYSNPRNAIETQIVNGILQKTLFSNVPQLFAQAGRERAVALIGSSSFAHFNQGIADTIAEAFGGDADLIRQRMEDGESGMRRLDLDDDSADAKSSGNASVGQPASAPASAAAKSAAAPVAQTASGSPQPGARPAAAPAATTPAATANPNLLSRIVQIDDIQVVGKEVKSPQATLLVGGWAIQFLLFALAASANALFYEKDHGLFQRLLSAPVTRSDILWSKFLYGVSLGLIQLVVLFTAGHILYGIEILPYLGRLVLVCIFAAGACTSFGMLLASLVSSPEAGRGLATLLILLMSAIGGAWFPVSLMPEFIQKLSRFTLVYWSMEGFSHVLWAHAGLIELLPVLGILGGITAAVMAVAVWRFNRGKLFD
jgi:ABC-2 type transport system permease protein